MPNAICARVQLQMVRRKNIAVVMVLVLLNVARHIARLLDVTAITDGQGKSVSYLVSFQTIREMSSRSL